MDGINTLSGFKCKLASLCGCIQGERTATKTTPVGDGVPPSSADLKKGGERAAAPDPAPSKDGKLAGFAEDEVRGLNVFFQLKVVPYSARQLCDTSTDPSLGLLLLSSRLHSPSLHLYPPVPATSAQVNLVGTKHSN